MCTILLMSYIQIFRKLVNGKKVIKTTVIFLKKMQSDRKGSYNSCIMYAVSQMEFLSFIKSKG